MGKLKRRLEQSGLSLIISLPANDVRLAKAALEEGADALKVHFNVGHRASGTHFGPLDRYEDTFSEIRAAFDGPFGVVPSGSLEGVSEEEIRRLAPLGFDFYSIYAHHLPSFMLEDHGLDRTLPLMIPMISIKFWRGCGSGSRRLKHPLCLAANTARVSA